MPISESFIEESKNQDGEKAEQTLSQKPSFDIREERLKQVKQELAKYNFKSATQEEIKQTQKQREAEFNMKIAELEEGFGSRLSQESRNMIYQNMVVSVMEKAQGDNEKFNNLHRLKKAAEILSPKDFQYFEKILGNQEGRIDRLFELKDMALHTTNSFYFKKMLDQGIIKTNNGKGGIYSSSGASFTDGSFPEAATFQMIYEDQNTHNSIKQFDSQPYGDKVESFVRYFWNQKQEETKLYLSKLSDGKAVETYEDALDIAKSFKFKAKPKEIKDNPEAIDKLFGVTIAFNKDKMPDLTKDGTAGLQRDFELRSYRNNGVPMSEAKVIFVPEIKIQEINKDLQKKGLTHIEVRPSEELEVIRMIQLLG